MTRRTGTWLRSTGSILILTLVASVACSSGTGTGGEDDRARELVVFAAASLSGAFEEIGVMFEEANRGTTITFNTGPSDGLAAQIQSEGTADVFASASERWMDEVAADPGVGERTVFVRNRLVVITPLDDPAWIASIDDLARSGIQLVLAAEGVPVGDYARESLANAGILEEALANLVSNEEDAAAVVAKIAAGEADAAIAYASDVSTAAGNEVRAVAIPDDVNVVATYPIAVVEGSDRTALAEAFVTFVTGASSQQVLDRFGFEPV